MTSPTRTAATPMTGILASGGSTMVHALVYHQQTPQVPPESLVGVVDPIRNDDGSVRDWRLSVPRLLGQRVEPVYDIKDEFVKWRTGFVTERLLGDVATVRAFLQWAEHLTDITALRVICLPHARIDQKRAPRVAWQAHEAAAACRARAEKGLGVTSPTRTGVVRGFVVGPTPLLVLGQENASVFAVPAGFELHDNDAPVLLVHGWLVRTDGITVITDNREVALGNSLGGRLLAQVAPGVSQASAVPVPLTSIFSGLLVHLPELALLAARNGTSLLISAGGPDLSHSK